MALHENQPEQALRSSRTLPPEETHQEAAYLKTLGAKQQPVKIKLMDGSVVRGWIEYYDRRMLRLTRKGQANLFIFKHQIAYIAEEAGARHPGDNDKGKSARAAK